MIPINFLPQKFVTKYGIFSTYSVTFVSQKFLMSPVYKPHQIHKFVGLKTYISYITDLRTPPTQYIIYANPVETHTLIILGISAMCIKSGQIQTIYWKKNTYRFPHHTCKSYQILWICRRIRHMVTILQTHYTNRLRDYICTPYWIWKICRQNKLNFDQSHLELSSLLDLSSKGFSYVKWQSTNMFSIGEVGLKREFDPSHDHTAIAVSTAYRI